MGLDEVACSVGLKNIHIDEMKAWLIPYEYSNVVNKAFVVSPHTPVFYNGIVTKVKVILHVPANK